MRINPLAAPTIFISILIGTILVSQLNGSWTVSGRATVVTENLAIEDIKGWMTLQQLMDGVHISKDELYSLLKVPAEVPGTTALKDLESLVPGFETSTVREVLTARTETRSVAATEIRPTPTPQATAKPSATPFAAGQVLSASQIKGKMTLREVSEQCAVGSDALLNGLKLPPNTDADTQIKALVEQGLLIEVSQVQTVVEALQR